MIYLDNNATTFMPKEVIKTMCDWANKGNPSANYESAKMCRKMMTNFRKYIAKLCNFDECCEEDRDTDDIGENQLRKINDDLYKIIFNSCASEGNSHIITSVVNSYCAATETLPHLVVSAIEHKSVLNCAKHLEENGWAEVTYVPCMVSGHINPEDVRKAIRPNTCLVAIMHANNETGAINDIAKIGEIAHRHKVPFHVDAVQTFGKFPLKPIDCNVDSFTVSFHKLHGPPGVGALVVKQKYLIGYSIAPIVFGTQNENLRGGTENIMGIAASFDATKHTMEKRQDKNRSMFELKKYICEELAKTFPTRQYRDYKARKDGPKMEIIFLSGLNGYLPNTILLAIVHRTKELCNSKIRDALAKEGIIVSVGSACNTASPKASHVLYAMDVDDVIRRGVLRISLGDDSTKRDAKEFVETFSSMLAKLAK